MTAIGFSQSLSDKYLHFRTVYYWDTTIYKSELSYYYEVSNGKIAQKEYPVLQYIFTRIVSDSPCVTKDTFERRGWSEYPYKYVRKGNSIFLQYLDLEKRNLQLKKEYPLNRSDTVKSLANKNSLDGKNGISGGGFSIYLGVAIIDINGKQFKTFRFLEDHLRLDFHPSYHTKEVFLEQTTLIPIKFITTEYDYRSRQRILYSHITILASSSNILPDYSNKTTEDLVLYENKSTVWNAKQRKEFLKMFSSEMQKYGNCLLNKLDGRISFFHFEQNNYFRSLVMKKECE